MRNAVLWGLMVLTIAVGSVLGRGNPLEPLNTLVRIGDLSVRLPEGFNVDTRTTDTGKVLFADRDTVEVRVLVRDDVSAQDALKMFYTGQAIATEPVLMAGRPGTLATFVEPGQEPRVTHVAMADTADGRLLLIELAATGRPDARRLLLLRRIVDVAVLEPIPPGGVER